MENKMAVKCSECGKFFKRDFGVCPFCGTEPIESCESKKSFEYNADSNKPEEIDTEKAFVGTCERCGREAVLLRKYTIKDDFGTRYRNLCENCISKYNEKSSIQKINFLSEKKGLIFTVVLIAVVLLLIIILSGTETCSQCGKAISEGYSVMGEPWCKDCFYS